MNVFIMTLLAQTEIYNLQRYDWRPKFATVSVCQLAWFVLNCLFYIYVEGNY